MPTSNLSINPQKRVNLCYNYSHRVGDMSRKGPGMRMINNWTGLAHAQSYCIFAVPSGSHKTPKTLNRLKNDTFNTRWQQQMAQHMAGLVLAGTLSYVFCKILQSFFFLLNCNVLLVHIFQWMWPIHSWIGAVTCLWWTPSVPPSIYIYL